jgi:hypothetical protein
MEDSMYGVRYVTIAKFCELTGYTPSGVYNRKCKGIWLEGTVWTYEPGTKKILIDLEAFERYVESGEPIHEQFRRTLARSPSPPNLTAATKRRSPLLPKLDPPEPRRRRSK